MVETILDGALVVAVAGAIFAALCTAYYHGRYTAFKDILVLLKGDPDAR